ncbi:MAG: hypothetical protein ABI855_11300 [Bacteroidota bacterium]
MTDNGSNKVQEVTADANEKRKSLGMTVTKERLDIISKIKKSKAFFVFDDLLDSNRNVAGTKVQLTVPASFSF